MKKIKYIKPIVEILLNISNWLEVMTLYFSPREMVMNLRKGTSFKINNFHNLISIKEVFIDKEYFIKKIKPKTIIDIGANLGDSTIFFSQTYPKARIYAYEPSPSVFSLLQYNLKINNIRNVNPFKLGVGSKSGQVSFYENQQSGLSSMYNSSANTLKKNIKVVSLPQIFKDNKILKCDLLKVDCEGAEYDILLKLEKSFIKNIKNMVIEYHEGATKYGHSDIVKFLKINKFKVKIKRHEIEKNIGIIYATK